MNSHKHKLSALLLAVSVLLICSLVATADAAIEILRTPNGGIQPRAVVDDAGTIHLIYYKRATRNGNLFYVTRRPDADSWTDPVRVNTEADSVVPNGSIGMAHLALGMNGRLHASWFDMRGAKHWYTRLNDDKSAFEPQRNLVTQFNKGIEASAALAADALGNVYMVWHAGNLGNEAKRSVYLTHSKDDGETFSYERRANPGDTGSCGCCGLSAIVDRDGTLYISYRAAGNRIHRDMTLLKSSDRAQSFAAQTIDTWELDACPVTTTAFAQRPESGVVVAWETQGRGYLADTDRLSSTLPVGPPPPAGRQKNPSLAVNGAGNTLIAWGVGAGWSSGGKLHWQVFDADGNPTDDKGNLDRDMPRGSVPAAVALPDGQFVIIH